MARLPEKTLSMPYARNDGVGIWYEVYAASIRHLEEDPAPPTVALRSAHQAGGS